MKKNYKAIGVRFVRPFHFFSIAILLFLGFATNLSADAPPALTSLRSVGTNSEGVRTFTLEWDATPGTLYRLQSRSGLESNAPWSTFDLMVATNEKATYRVTPDKMEAGAEGIRREFFQVLQPQPEIFGIEPALISSNGGTVYLFGQCFGTNPSVRIGGHVFTVTPTLIEDKYEFTISADFLTVGTYDVEVLDGTNVLATEYKLFSVTAEVQPVGAAAQALLEPPVNPPASPLSSLLMPALMKAKEKANRTKCANNLRILPSTGELQFEEEDLIVPGRGLDFVWTRIYRSRTGRSTSMGQNWSHGYDLRVFLEAGGIVVVLDGTGRSDRYFPGTNGLYTCNQIFNTGTLSNGLFTLHFPDTGKWIFHSISNATIPGAIERIEDRHGNAITFTYDGSGLMTEVIDTLNRTNRISYDSSGRVISVSDFLGRLVTYGYGRDSAPDRDQLRFVTTPAVTGTPNGNDFPLGKTTIYTYSQGFADERLNHNLLSITDPKGQLWLQCVYHPTLDPLDVSFDRLSSVTRGSDAPALYTYARQTPAASNRWSVVRTICTDPVGNVSMDWFDSLNRCVIHRDLAPRAVAGTPVYGTNLPTAKLRSTDPDFWETTYEWNVDSMCTRVVHPRGNSTEIVHQRAQDHNSSRSNRTSSRASDGNPRIVRQRACCGGADTDDDGLIVTRYEYDPRFSGGSDVVSIILPAVSQVAINQKGTGADKNRVLPTVNKITELDACFVTRCVDPRGNVSVATYDGQGSCITMENQGAGQGIDDNPRFDFEYNSFGQMTAVIRAADQNGFRRRDQMTYHHAGEQNGYMHTFTVDTTGPTVRTTIYDYDASGAVKEVIDPKGGSTKFHNNQLNQVVRRTEGSVVCNPCGPYLTDQFYDENDNLVRTEADNIDVDGVLDAANPKWTTIFVYDELDRSREVLREWTYDKDPKFPLFTTNRFVYDGNDNVIREISPEAANSNDPNNIVCFEFDTRDLLHRQWSGNGTPESTTNTYDYDENGIVVRATDRAGNTDSNLRTTLYEYDGFDRCKRVIDAMGNTITFTYDGNGNVLSARNDGQLVDVPGSVDNLRMCETRLEYDALDQCVRTRVSWFDIFSGLPLLDGEAVSTASYAPNGACRSMTDPRGFTTRYTYDTSSRLASVNDPKTNTVTYTYDLNDNVVTVTQSDTADVQPVRQTFVTTYEYDVLDRRVAQFDNVGNTNRYFYDSRGNMARHRDPRGNEVCYKFDGLGQCTGDISYVGPCDAGITISTSHVEYDSNSRMTSRTDANGNVTRHAYDALNRCVATTNADNTVLRLIWSPRSNLASSIDANGTRVVYTYDDLNRVTRKDISPGPTVSSATTFEEFSYDGASRCVTAINDVSSLAFSFDSMGNCVSYTQDGWQLLAAFDKNNNRNAIALPNGRTILTTYDNTDQLSTVSTSPGGGLPAVNFLTLAYDGPGRLARIARSNGINTRLTYNGMVQPQNSPGDFGAGQVSLINHQVAGAVGAVVDRRLSAYDRSQNKILRQQTVPFPTGVPAMTTNLMGYDALNSMSSFARNRASSAYTKTIAMDGNGNRQMVASNGVAAFYTMDPTLPQPADFQVDQYTGTPFGSQEHDLNGNMVFIPSPVGGTQFTYDYANRLVDVSRHVGPALVPIVSFTYDALGRRISKTRYPAAPALPITSVYYLDPDSDDDGVLEEFENGSPKKTIVFPHALEASGRIYLFGGHTYYTHVDDLGSALALTDETGMVVERYDYDEFGSVRFLTPEGVPMVNGDGTPTTTSPHGNDHLFRGMCWDGEIGLYSESGKFTDPLTGQRLSRGLWADCGRSSRTAFNNNPWSASARRGIGGNNCRFFTSRSASAHGDPVHGVDVKLGLTARAQGDPIHGVDIKLGMAARAQGDPVHGVDVKLGYKSKEDVYVWKVRGRTTSKEDVYVWKVKGGIKSKEDVYVWKLGEEGGRHTPFQNGVVAPRDAASGLPTGRRQYEPIIIRKRIDKSTPLLARVSSPRDSASGMATGKRQHSPIRFVAELSSHSIVSPRDAASGLATGKRQHKPIRIIAELDRAQVKSPRDAASGLATGKRQHKPFTIVSPHDPAGPFASSTSGGVMHWSLEVRVDRIEMK